MPPNSLDTAQIGALTADAVLSAIDDALEEQSRWLNLWHRALVCGLPPERDVIAPDSEQRGEFGRWHSKHSDDPLMAQKALQELWGSFVEVHQKARAIAQTAGEGARVRPSDYDNVVASVENFQGQARRIRDAFRKAVSDLDPLTGLSNRTTMNVELAAEYDRAIRTDAPCCIALSDIDHFKKVNDTHGHSVGDEVLAATAGRFLSKLRPYDMIYRYGGEEFLICLPNTDVEGAITILNRLRVTLGERPIPLKDGGEVPVTASFGFARIQSGQELKATIERADQALYVAKQAGRNRVEQAEETSVEDLF